MTVAPSSGSPILRRAAAITLRCACTSPSESFWRPRPSSATGRRVSRSYNRSGAARGSSPACVPGNRSTCLGRSSCPAWSPCTRRPAAGCAPASWRRPEVDVVVGALAHELLVLVEAPGGRPATRELVVELAGSRRLPIRSAQEQLLPAGQAQELGALP